MADRIDKFKGKYHFLSNFYLVGIKFESITYPSVEHAYQAAKTNDKDKRRKISQVKESSKAKRLGRTVVLREDWEDVKLDVMRALVETKFKTLLMREMLLATGKAYLEEGNWWGDTFWGVCKGQGCNHLGKILMEVREQLQNE